VAAFNGDFSMVTGPFAGSTNGPFFVDGEMFRFVDDRPSLLIDSSGNPRIATLDTQLTLTTADGTSFDIPAVNRPLENGGLSLYTPRWGASTDAPAGSLEVALAAAQLLRSDGSVSARVMSAPTVTGNHAIAPGTVVVSANAEQARQLDRILTDQMVSIRSRTRFIVSSDPTDLSDFSESPDSSLDIQHAVGGWPILVRESGVLFEPRDEEPAHPRTAFGFDERQMILLVIDGRAAGHSRGVTLPELAEFMQSLGCTDALNLDGGGSSTCWVRGRVLNRTSDGAERRVPNGLALVSSGSVGAPAHITFDEGSMFTMTPGARVILDGRVTDDRLHLIPNPEPIRLSSADDAVRIEGAIVTAERLGSSRVIASSGSATGAIDVTVLDRPDRLVLRPTVLHLVPGETAAVEVLGVDRDGTPVVLGPSSIRARAGRASVSIDADRPVLLVNSSEQGCREEVSVEASGLAAALPVAVASAVEFESFDSFDDLHPLTFAKVPDTVTGSASIRTEENRARNQEGNQDEDPEEDAQGDQRFARLEYAFHEQNKVQAAYLRLDRPLGEALKLGLDARGDGSTVNVKVALVDGNGARLLYTLHDGPLDNNWRPLELRLPDGLKQPLSWQSIYVVTTDTSRYAASGRIDLDNLTVFEIRD
jgi:hypothetical protein